MSQNVTNISGVVCDQQKQPINGATIIEKGTKNGSFANPQGHFQISIKNQDAIIVVSATGLISTNFNVKDFHNGDTIILNTADKELNQVVVVGYTSQKAKYLSSAVSTVNSDKLTDVTSSDLGTLLQGKMPGLVASSNSGDPTSSSTMIVRGVSSINAGTGPLTVVDGIIGGTYDVNDVESVTLLKDAAATGLYGSRAANGVTIITTKLGKTGSKPVFEFNSLVGTSSPLHGKFKMMNSQQLYDYENSFTDVPPSYLQTNTNWWDLGFRNAVTAKEYLSARGGNENTQYYVGGVYYSEQGTLIDNGTKMGNLRANIKTKLSKNLKMFVGIDGQYTKNNTDPSGILYQIYTNMPFDNPFNSDGSPRDPRVDTNWIGRDKTNFLHSDQYNFSNYNSFYVSGDLNLDYTIAKHFTLSTYNRVTLGNDESNTYYDQRTQEGGTDNGDLTYAHNHYSTVINSNRLNYENSFGKHSIRGIIVQENEQGLTSTAGSSGIGLPAGKPFMSDATDIKHLPTGGKDEYSFNKYLGQLDYNYKETYFLVASFVRERSSRFGTDHPSANFAQFGASYILSNEKFLQNNKVINFLKLRASYGTTGNANIGNYAALGLLDISSNANYNGQAGALPLQKVNPNLTWEKNKQINVGIDAKFINRIDLSVDIYQKNSNDLLFQKNLPASLGYSYIFENAGSVRNRGLELNIVSQNLVNKFKWETNFNIAFNTNRVESLIAGSNTLPTGEAAFNPSSNQPIAVGHNMTEWRMPVWAGVNQDNGNPQWEQVSYLNGVKNITITSSYNLASTDTSLQFLHKNALPKFTGGITNTFSYARFSLSTFFNFVYGNWIYNGTGYYVDNDGVYTTYNSMVLQNGDKRWSAPGDKVSYPKPVYGGNLQSNANSSRYLENGSYLRLRNITLGYNFPDKWMHSIKISSAKFYISADNLWTITKFSGPNPDVTFNAVSQDGNAGNSSMLYPLSKKFVLGLSVVF